MWISFFEKIPKKFFLDFFEKFSNFLCFIFNLEKKYKTNTSRKAARDAFSNKKIIQIRSSILELQHCENG